jgi:integrase
MALTDAKIRAAKPRQKSYKLFDGEGLYLEVSPSGGKWWRLKYRINGKEKRLSLGTYPEVPLASSKNNISGAMITGAREKREAARQLLAEGIDPSQHRKMMLSAKEGLTADSFEAVTREWLVKFSARLKPSSVERKLKIFENDVFPWIGARPITALTAPEVLSVLRRIEDRGAGEIAARAKMYCGQAFRYAVATGRTERDPTQDLREALAPRVTGHHAAMTDPKAIGGLLRAIDAYEGYFVTRCALRLSPLVFVRPGELRNAQWSEIDFAEAQWTIPAERMKMKQPHIVPLSRQALAILQELHPKTKFSRYVFPSTRSAKRPMSEVAILAALRRMGFAKDEMSAHGFRAMARTLLDEVLGFRPDYIEHQLAHAVRDPNGRAYNRTSHLPQRREMMQKWADYLDGLRREGVPHPMVAA